MPDKMLTNCTYFGARYYDSDLSVWLSVDPMASERSWLSPYNYCQNSPVMRADPTGALDEGPDNYSVDAKGNVKLEQETDDKFDMLYTKADWDAGKFDNGKRVNDQKLLPALGGQVQDYNFNFAITSNSSDAFTVFYFAASNTDVEWSLNKQKINGSISYVILTSHLENEVHNSSAIYGYNEFNLIDRYHSHPGSKSFEGTRGASIGDEGRIRNMYYRFQNAGMKSPYEYFTVNGQTTKFPKHYLYHKKSGNLYEYTPWESSIFIKNIPK